ncbi:zinc-dependent peptidase [Nostoc sp. TCL26-01]|nr:zinc-dependent peptidase [Nostoc sp. TCL26-01]
MVSHPHCFICCYILPEPVYLPKVDAPDQEDGKAEGVPILPRKSDYSIWARVMTAEYQQLCNDVHQGIETVIDSYGATNPAEFFAVATETFFEKPESLLEKHPKLYKLLQNYYQVAPIQWI